MPETIKKLKYGVLFDHLREKITRRELSPGDRVPSLSQMQLQFQVSRGTVEKAYALLEQEGLLIREQGSGTFVAQTAEQCKTGILGFIMHANMQDMTSSYTLHLLAGIRQEAAKHNLKIQWLNPQDEKNISRANMDAVLMICHPTEALALGLPTDMPNVLLFQHSPDFHCVCANDAGGIKLAVKHLLSLGHRNISYLASTEIDSISQRRVAGYCAALEEAGISLNKDRLRFLSNSRSIGFRKSGEVTMETLAK